MQTRAEVPGDPVLAQDAAHQFQSPVDILGVRPHFVLGFQLEQPGWMTRYDVRYSCDPLSAAIISRYDNEDIGIVAEVSF